MSEYEGLLPEVPKSATEVLLASMKGESSYDASAYLERLRRENPVIPVSLEGLYFGQEHEIGPDMDMHRAQAVQGRTEGDALVSHQPLPVPAKPSFRVEGEQIFWKKF